MPTCAARPRGVRPDIGMVFQHFNLWPHNDGPAEHHGSTGSRAKARGARRPPTSLWRSWRRSGWPTSAMPIRPGFPADSSKGWRSRRALAMMPKIMLFDEATSALDPELRHEVLQVMRQTGQRWDDHARSDPRDGIRAQCSVPVSSSWMAAASWKIVLLKLFFAAPRTERASRFLCHCKISGMQS